MFRLICADFDVALVAGPEALNQTKPDRNDLVYSTTGCSIPNHSHETCVTQKFSAKNGEDTNERFTFKNRPTHARLRQPFQNRILT